MFRRISICRGATTAVVAFLLLSTAVHAQSSTVFVEGLKAPQKIIYAPKQDFFLVTEAGIPTLPNSGRVSVITNDGDRFTLIDGLPSGNAPPDDAPSGPSGLWIEGRQLYIAIGTGNATLPGPVPSSEIPNPSPNSPLLSSVLKYTFAWKGFQPEHSDTNILYPEDHTRLARGRSVRIGKYGHSRGTLQMLANFPNYTPAPRPGFPDLVRNSNPFGIVLHANTLYVADAAQNSIRKLTSGGGMRGDLIVYPPRPNPSAPFGPPVVDPVPDSLRLFGNTLLVTFLTGFPFNAGVADVHQFDLDSGVDSVVIDGLTTAIDVLPVAKDLFSNTVYTLEISSNLLAGAPGRLQRFDGAGQPPTVISDTLISPTSIARDPATGDLLVTEIFPGRISRIELP
ncbi:MAG TPA: ScyD/ScyE family protein [Woeseiaceae bacterium]|nr:ScyD/ScyE family protein [Woeseiaceae bacterium]